MICNVKFVAQIFPNHMTFDHNNAFKVDVIKILAHFLLHPASFLTLVVALIDWNALNKMS